MKGSRLSEDWELPEDWRDWALKERPDLNPDEIAEYFKDYWLSRSGQGASKCDWFRTWKNWIRNQAKPKGLPDKPNSHKVVAPHRRTPGEWQDAKKIGQEKIAALKKILDRA